MTKTTLDRIVQEIIGRILSVVKPQKVFLFGSAARDEMRENSDIDLLVVVPNGLHRRKTAQNIATCWVSALLPILWLLPKRILKRTAMLKVLSSGPL